MHGKASVAGNDTRPAEPRAEPTRAAFENRLADHAASILLLAELRMSVALRRWISPEDVAQEVMLEALQDRDRYDPFRSPRLRPWLAAITERKIQSAYRDMMRKPRPARINVGESMSGSGIIDSELAGSITTPSLAVARGERHVALRAALEGLKGDYREIIVLRHLHGLPLNDVAGRMNRTPAAAAMLLRRALRRLRDCYTELSGDKSARPDVPVRENTS